MDVIQGSIKYVVTFAEISSHVVVAVYACAERIFEVRHSGTVDEVEEMFLRGARGLEDRLDRGVAEDGKCRLQAGE